MEIANKFYSSRSGDKLVEPSNYPKEIDRFLVEESRMLTEYLAPLAVLIEIGCMQGRCLEYAIESSKFYIGLDIVEEYIEEARDRAKKMSISDEKYEFLCLGAANVNDILSIDRINTFSSEEALVFFPFNSFGNIDNIDDVFTSLRQTKTNFLISTYKTEDFANHARRSYYQKCCYKNINQINTEDGVRFTSDEGLNAIAYSSGWLISRFHHEGIQIQTIDLKGIGIGYVGKSFR